MAFPPLVHCPGGGPRSQAQPPPIQELPHPSTDGMAVRFAIDRPSPKKYNGGRSRGWKMSPNESALHAAPTGCQAHACCGHVGNLGKTAAAIIAILVGSSAPHAAEPPAINPFGQTPAEREDAVPGYVELSDGSIHPGLIYLTRDKRLQVYDQQLQRQREVPLQMVKQIECTIKRSGSKKSGSSRKPPAMKKCTPAAVIRRGVPPHHHS